MRVFLFVLAIATVICVASVGSTAQAATGLAMDSGSLSMANAKFVREGIPMPIVDSAVDGYFQYLGEGKFITESGVAFFWRDGHFVHADGTALEIPASAKEHLLSLGIDHQPTARDVAEAQAKAEAEPPAPDGAADTGGLVLLSQQNPWIGDYLHWGGLRGQTYGYTGTRADISVHDRSPGLMEYYGIGLATVNYPPGDNGLGFELADQVNTATTWYPTLHRLNPDTQWTYPNKAFNTANGGAVTKTVQMVQQSNGYVLPYLDGVIIDTTGIYWGPRDYIPQYTRFESAYEIASDSGASAPHDPANHYSNIQTRNSAGSWSLQTSSVTKFNYLTSNLNGQTSDGLYPFSHWVITNYYDWMARP